MLLQTTHGKIDCSDSLSIPVERCLSLWPNGTLPILRQITIGPIAVVTIQGVALFYDAENIQIKEHQWERPAIASDILINETILNDKSALETVLHHELAHVLLTSLYGFDCVSNPFYGLYLAHMGNFLGLLMGRAHIIWGHWCWAAGMSQEQRETDYKTIKTAWATIPISKPVSISALHHLAEYSAETLAYYITAPELLKTLDPGGFIIAEYIIHMARDISERYPIRSVPEPSKSKCRSCLWTITSRRCGIAFRPSSENCKMHEAQ